MPRERESFLRDDRRLRSMSIKCRTACQSCCRIKPETNLAMMFCLVFYLYICLGGALFLLLEGRPDVSGEIDPELKKLFHTFNLSGNNINAVIKYCDILNGNERRKKPKHLNRWNFLESTDFAYRVISGQGTTQATRVLHTTGGKIAYIVFLCLGMPLTVLTLRATGNRLNILVYSIIRFINSKIFSRQVTPNIHVKALIFNIFIFVTLLLVGMAMYSVTQDWNLLDSFFYTISVVFTVSNTHEKVINKDIPMNSDKDKLLRVLFNLFSFASLTVLSSIAWSAHHFTRHMRFKAQNQQIANNGEARQICPPWLEITRGQSSSPTKSTRERETDRESVC